MHVSQNTNIIYAYLYALMPYISSQFESLAIIKKFVNLFSNETTFSKDIKENSWQYNGNVDHDEL